MSFLATHIIDTVGGVLKDWQDIEALSDWGNIGGTITNQTDLFSTFYTQSEIDGFLALKSAIGHDHDDRYYTEAEVDVLIASAGGSAAWGGITGTITNQTDLFTTFYTQTEIDGFLAFKSNVGHDHDDRYYTEAETDALFAALTIDFDTLTGGFTTLEDTYGATGPLARLIEFVDRFGFETDLPHSTPIEVVEVTDGTPSVQEVQSIIVRAQSGTWTVEGQGPLNYYATEGEVETAINDALGSGTVTVVRTDVAPGQVTYEVTWTANGTQPLLTVDGTGLTGFPTRIKTPLSIQCGTFTDANAPDDSIYVSADGDGNHLMFKHGGESHVLCNLDGYGGGLDAGGDDTEIQFNNSGQLDGDPLFTWTGSLVNMPAIVVTATGPTITPAKIKLAASHSEPALDIEDATGTRIFSVDENGDVVAEVTPALTNWVLEIADGSSQGTASGVPLLTGGSCGVGSFSFWFKRDAGTSVTHTSLWEYGNLTYSSQYGMYWNTGGGPTFTGAGRIQPTTDWRHVVVASDGSNIDVYLDGVYQESDTSGNGLQVGTDFHINKATSGDWDIEDFRVYDSDIQASEAADLAAGNEVSGKTPIFHLKFNEGSGTTVADEIGSADFTLGNAMSFATGGPAENPAPNVSGSPTERKFLQMKDGENDGENGVMIVGDTTCRADIHGVEVVICAGALGVVAGKFDADNTAAQTRFLVYDNDTGTLRRVGVWNDGTRDLLYLV